MPEKFIVLEGIDGCGKSTQSKLLKDYLKKEGIELIILKEPSNNPIGQFIKQSLIGKVSFSPEALALLYTADRLEEVKTKIKPGLKSKKWVLSERYTLASLVYQGIEGVNISWIRKVSNYLPKPKIKILIDIPAEEALKRIKNRAIRHKYEEINMLKKARRRYLTLAKSEGYKIINGMLPKEAIHKQIIDILRNYTV